MRFLDAAMVAHIQFCGESMASDAAKFFGKVSKRTLVPAGDSQVSAGIRKCSCKVLPEAAAGSSYQCDVCQSELEIAS